jgi:hypothetical protein
MINYGEKKSVEFGLQKTRVDLKKGRRIDGSKTLSAQTNSNLSDNNIIDQIWEWYRNEGIVQFVGKWVGRTFSNLELTIEYKKQPYHLVENLSPTKISKIERILNTLRTYNGLQSEFLMEAGTHLAIAGEVYLIPIKDEDGDCYFVANRQQIRTNKGVITEFVDVPDYVTSTVRKTAENELTVYKIIDQMPGKADLPDSWLIGAEKTLCQYETMKESIHTALLSQINAPILVYPSEVEIESPNMTDGVDDELADNMTQYLRDDLANKFSEGVDEMDPFGRLLPYILGLPSDVAKLYTVNLHRNIDPALMEGLKHAFHNILLAAPIPQENILGLGDSNHWDNAQITKDSFQKCIKPYADLIVGALSAELIRPYFKNAELTDYRLSYDSSPIIIPQDKTTEAQNQFTKGLITLNEARDMAGLAKTGSPVGEMFHFQLYTPTNENSGGNESLSGN